MSKTSAWAIDVTGNITPSPYVWGTNCGQWRVTSTGYLTPMTNMTSQDYDFLWTLSGTNLTPRSF